MSTIEALREALDKALEADDHAHESGSRDWGARHADLRVAVFRALAAQPAPVEPELLTEEEARALGAEICGMTKARMNSAEWAAWGRAAFNALPARFKGAR